MAATPGSALHARNIVPNKRRLTSGQRHLLSLLKQDAKEDGWAAVSKPVARLFTDKQIPGGAMPEELCEFEYVGTEGAGRARLTQKGEAVLEALQWL